MPVGNYNTAKNKVVFISYNHNDIATANKLRDRLATQNIDVLIDNEDMRAGGDIQEFIDKCVRESDVTLSLVSSKSLLSAWVAMESINTFYNAKTNTQKKLIACYLTDEFFKMEFTDTALDYIDDEIKKWRSARISRDEKGRSTRDLDDQLSRLEDLKNNLDAIIDRLREKLCIDIRDEHFENNFNKILDAINQSDERIDFQQHTNKQVAQQQVYQSQPAYNSATPSYPPQPKPAKSRKLLYMFLGILIGAILICLIAVAVADDEEAKPIENNSELSITTSVETDKEQIKTAINEASKNYIQALTSFDTTGLSNSYSNEMIDTILAQIKQATDNDYFYKNANLENRSIKSIDVSSDGKQATVKTDENWSFVLYRFSTQQFYNNIPSATYPRNYSLLKNAGKWIISSELGESANSNTDY